MKCRHMKKIIMGALAASLMLIGVQAERTVSHAATAGKTTTTTKVATEKATSKTIAASDKTSKTTTAEKAVEKKSYTVSPRSLPYKKKFVKQKEYNSLTRQYFMLRSYIEKLGAQGGGTLTLKKGTYRVPCTLYVASNITINLKNGAKIVKTTQTGVHSLTPTNFLFEMVSGTKAKKTRAIGGYGASANVKITGEKNSVIDLGNAKARTGIYVGHATDISVQGITFKNRKGGNYIWIESSRTINVSGCTFQEGKTGSGIKSRMAVRLENIEPLDDTYPEKWGKYDKTVNQTIRVDGCTFKKPQIAVGTSICSADGTTDKPVTRYQTGIQITNNTITGYTSYAIYARGWSGAVITGNKITKGTAEKKAAAGVYGGAVISPKITGNTFSGCEYAVHFKNISSYGPTDDMITVESEFDSASTDSMAVNTAKNISHYYCLYKKARIAYIRDKSEKKFTVRTDSAPYHEYYTNYSQYSARRLYYVFKSYMEQLEYAGGGVLTIEAGTYEVLGNICVPSNVTIILKDGVTMRKIAAAPGEKQISKAIFTIVPPSKERATGLIYGYGGSQNVKITGSGTVVLDCNNVLKGSGVVMGHAKNVTIQGIQFMNEYGSHFIELNSSYNVLVENCTFKNFKIYEDKSHKEAINVDGTDENTGGFPFSWSSHDKTVCKKVYIRNNTFQNVGTAVGSHTYIAKDKEQQYHTGVEITGNTVDSTYNSAIRTLNWKDCVIRGNTFKNIGSIDDGRTNSNGEKILYPAIYVRGTVNPEITDNSYDTLNYYPIQVVLTCSAKSAGSIADGYPDTVCDISDEKYALMQQESYSNIDEKYRYILIQDYESSELGDTGMLQLKGK